MKEITVLKIGGSTLEDEDLTVQKLAILKKEGEALAVVHGGGKEIDEALQESQIQSVKLDGQRVTDKETLEVVTSVLNNINRRLAGKLEAAEAPVLQFESGTVLDAHKTNPNLGFVGIVKRVRTQVLRQAIVSGKIPVIAPVGTDLESENLLNINADFAAAAVAIALKARLILITDVPGVLENGALIDKLTPLKYHQLLQERVVTSGMIPKIDAGFLAVAANRKVLICNTANILSAFQGQPIGTKL